MKNTILTIYDGSAKLARLGDPAIRVRKSGRIEFNTMAMMLLDLKEGGSVVFARESLAPNRWYVRKSSDTTGIKVNHYHAAFCRKLAKDILLDTPPPHPNLSKLPLKSRKRRFSAADIINS